MSRMRWSLVLACAAALGCIDAGSSSAAGQARAITSTPDPVPEPEPEPTPDPFALELLAVRDGPMDLLTTGDTPFVRIEGELLHLDDRGRPVPGWSWPPLFEKQVTDPYIREEEVDAFGGPADRPILSLALYLSRWGGFHRVHQFGGDGSTQTPKIEHQAIEGYYSQIANWGDQVVALVAWMPGHEYFEQGYIAAPTAKQRRAWAAVERSLRSAPQGLALVSGSAGDPVPDLAGLIPMALTSDAAGNLHAIAHTLAPEFDAIAVMREHDDSYFSHDIHTSPVNVGILGGEVEQYTVHEYVHLRWRPGETTPERHPLPGLEQAQVRAMYLSVSAATSLAVRLDGQQLWLGVFEDGRWRVLPSDGLPSEKSQPRYRERSPDLTIDALEQAWMLADGELWRLPPAADEWVRQRLPATPIPARELDVFAAGPGRGQFPPGPPHRQVPEGREWSRLTALELAWARGSLWLVAGASSKEIQLLFRIVDDAVTKQTATPPDPVELPSSAEIYRRVYQQDPETQGAP